MTLLAEQDNAPFAAKVDLTFHTELALLRRPAYFFLVFRAKVSGQLRTFKTDWPTRPRIHGTCPTIDGLR